MRKIVCAVILALLLLALLTLTFSIQAEQAIFYDDFDAGLVQWNNFGYPTPATFQDPSFEDGWGYSTEGDSWHLSGSWSKNLSTLAMALLLNSGLNKAQETFGIISPLALAEPGLDTRRNINRGIS